MEDFQGQLLTDRYSLTDLHGQILIKNVYSSPLIKSKRAPVREGRVFHTETKQVQRNTERSGGLWCPGCKKMKCSKNTLTLIQTAYKHFCTVQSCGTKPLLIPQWSEPNHTFGSGNLPKKRIREHWFSEVTVCIQLKLVPWVLYNLEHFKVVINSLTQYVIPTLRARFQLNRQDMVKYQTIQEQN